MAHYQQQLASRDSLGDKVAILASCRTEEGYMAIAEERDGDWWLIEMHCPICEAARFCQGFCQSELNCFQCLFTDIAAGTRESYMLEGESRCSYRFRAC